MGNNFRCKAHLAVARGGHILTRRTWDKIPLASHYTSMRVSACKLEPVFPAPELFLLAYCRERFYACISSESPRYSAMIGIHLWTSSFGKSYFPPPNITILIMMVMMTRIWTLEPRWSVQCHYCAELIFPFKGHRYSSTCLLCNWCQSTGQWLFLSGGWRDKKIYYFLCHMTSLDSVRLTLTIAHWEQEKRSNKYSRLPHIN